LMIRQQFPSVTLHLVGSSSNGFASDVSDADFCIMVSFKRSVDQSYEARCYLQDIERLFHSMRSLKNIQLIQAKVPILRFEDTVSGCECDLNINNSVGIRNTRLLRTYSNVDSRTRPLVMMLKRWAKARGINDASHGTLSSYSIVLMALHFLQFGTEPPVLHSLQKLYPDCFKPGSEVEDTIDLTKVIPCNTSNNKQSVGQLFKGFFTYFADKFSWEEEVMSVRLGCTISKQENVEFHGKFICIEEPFNLSNTARAVHEMHHYQLIKGQIARARTLLAEHDSIKYIL